MSDMEGVSYTGSSPTPGLDDAVSMLVKSDLTGTVPYRPDSASADGFLFSVPLSNAVAVVDIDQEIPKSGERRYPEVFQKLTKDTKDIWSANLQEKGLDSSMYDHDSAMIHASVSLFNAMKRASDVAGRNSNYDDGLPYQVDVGAGTLILEDEDGASIPLFGWRISVPGRDGDAPTIVASSMKFTQDLMRLSASDYEDVPAQLAGEAPQSVAEVAGSGQSRTMRVYRPWAPKDGSFELTKEKINPRDIEFPIELGTRIEGTASQVQADARKAWEEWLTKDNVTKTKKEKEFWRRRDYSGIDEWLTTTKDASAASLKKQLETRQSDPQDRYTLWTGLGTLIAGKHVPNSMYVGWQLEREGNTIASSLDYSDIHQATAAPPVGERTTAQYQKARKGHMERVREGAAKRMAQQAAESRALLPAFSTAGNSNLRPILPKPTSTSAETGDDELSEDEH